MQHIGGLDGGIKDLRRVIHHARVDGGILPGIARAVLLQEDQLVGRFLVREMDIGHGDKIEQLAILHHARRLIASRHQIGAALQRQSHRQIVPLTITQLVITMGLVELAPCQRIATVGT